MLCACTQYYCPVFHSKILYLLPLHANSAHVILEGVFVFENAPRVDLVGQVAAFSAVMLTPIHLIFVLYTGHGLPI